MTKSGVTQNQVEDKICLSKLTLYWRSAFDGYPQNAEKVNGRWAMVGFVALLGAYLTAGQDYSRFWYLNSNFYDFGKLHG